MLSRLVLSDFRNHADFTLAPGPGFVVLTGENGSGKTNVLEAVSLLTPGKGLRRANLSDMARQGGPGGFGVAATLDGDAEVATGAAAGAPERRVVRVNGAAGSAAALPEWITVLWLTPATDRLFVEPAGAAALPRPADAGAGAGHATHAARYEAAMRARNRLLSEEAAPDPNWLGALEAQMAEHGAAVDRARRGAVALLAARLAEQPPGPFARAGLLLEGWSGDADRLRRELRDGRGRDAAAGRALSGPHRADLMVTHLEKGQPAALASTGEQKALLLGVVLAHAELVADRTGRAPVLLLDEVAAHLDPTRRAALFARLAGRGQVWVTGTEPALFEAIDGGATRIALG